MIKNFFGELFPIFKLFLFFLGSVALFLIVISCCVYLDINSTMSTLEIIRYCPVCGLDLIYHS